MRNFNFESGLAHSNPTPNEIAHFLIDNVGNSIADRSDYTIVILGRPGPTGKTWLCNVLRQHNFNAVEISEEITPFVNWLDSKKNYYFTDPYTKHITIILNAEWGCDHA